MKELLEEIKLNPYESFYIGIFQDHIDKSRWHYHQEFELSFITEGSGKRIVGDSIEEFHPGDLIFIGQRIPHVWLSEESHRQQHSGRTLESVYMLFNQDILPSGLTQLPEFENIRKAVQLSERGIRITGDTLNEVSSIMLQLPYMNSMKRLMFFYEIMDLIGKSETFSYLASEEYVKTICETFGKYQKDWRYQYETAKDIYVLPFNKKTPIQIDGEVVNYGDKERFEFTWDGNDECDPAQGSGWVEGTAGNEIPGRIKPHLGDSSDFRAVKVE